MGPEKGDSEMRNWVMGTVIFGILAACLGGVFVAAWIAGAPGREAERRLKESTAEMELLLRQMDRIIEMQRGGLTRREAEDFILREAALRKARKP
jgi:hypothetical protein